MNTPGSNIITLAILTVKEIFDTKIQSAFSYHTWKHTIEVTNMAIELGNQHLLPKEQVEAIHLASIFHDSGFSLGLEDHELSSIRLFDEFIEKEMSDYQNKSMVRRLVQTTSLSGEPADLSESIMRDADLHYLGTNSYFEQSTLLRKEWELTRNLHLSDVEWYKINIGFFHSHKYYTSEAQRRFATKKNSNLEEITELLNKLTNDSTV